jgi:hypothetical protein
MVFDPADTARLDSNLQGRTAIGPLVAVELRAATGSNAAVADVALSTAFVSDRPGPVVASVAPKHALIGYRRSYHFRETVIGGHSAPSALEANNSMTPRQTSKRAAFFYANAPARPGARHQMSKCEMVQGLRSLQSLARERQNRQNHVRPQFGRKPVNGKMAILGPCNTRCAPQSCRSILPFFPNPRWVRVAVMLSPEPVATSRDSGRRGRRRCE